MAIEVMRDRSAFGYMEPSPDIADFAQCGSCQLWLKDKERCYWLAKDLDVDGDDSCIMYVQGDPITDDNVEPTGALTPEEVGFVKDIKVRCENCVSYKLKVCLLFRKLTQSMPDIFKLDEKVKPRACCNAYDQGSKSDG